MCQSIANENINASNLLRTYCPKDVSLKKSLSNEKTSKKVY